MVTVHSNGTAQAGTGYFKNGPVFSSELRSVTKIVKYLNKQHNSDALTFKTVSEWLAEEGYWQKEAGKIRPTQKGVANGMSMQHCCLNGKEFDSVYCDRKMQTIISGKFGSFYDNINISGADEETVCREENVKMPAADRKMAQTWKELAVSYYEKGCFKEAADCYKNMIECIE